MRQYYYMIASLPLLEYNSPPPLDLEQLYYSCKNNIQQDDLDLISDIRLHMPEETASKEPTLRKWLDWERSLRNELVRLRGQKQGVESERYLREGEFVPDTVLSAREAFSQDSPLEGEEVLNRARWNKLEELEVGHHFDLVKLLVYVLKLHLLLRRSHFTTEKGREKFEEIYAHI
ncbi:MAG TPA: DUF2764 family protein, partial [Sediminispirochaeta sp.]|nr:DUF2764 family protein [Sediminispirochaeta sp.]